MIWLSFVSPDPFFTYYVLLCRPVSPRRLTSICCSTWVPCLLVSSRVAPKGAWHETGRQEERVMRIHYSLASSCLSVVQKCLCFPVYSLSFCEATELQPWMVSNYTVFYLMNYRPRLVNGSLFLLLSRAVLFPLNFLNLAHILEIVPLLISWIAFWDVPSG